MIELFLTFDCEDFINRQSTLALCRILELLQKHDLRAIFFLTGNFCEKLSTTPKILDLLESHEIGYHSSSHSAHPNIPEYTDVENYNVAFSTSLQRETARVNPLTGELEGRGGFVLFRDLWPNKKVVSFRAPGFCWSPPHLEALQELGVRYDFSTNLSQTLTCYKNVTFCPYAHWGFGFATMARTYVSSLLTFRRRALSKHNQTLSILFHPDNLVNTRTWDYIYYNGNPRNLNLVPPRSWKNVQKDLTGFELFLKRISFLARKGIFEVTPPLREGRKTTNFAESDVLRDYQRSVRWCKRYFNYRPKFLLNHFFKYFDLESH
jgi:peptidoglycan/xylan/chitin deacetylase (PgdA/CDA1 family)